MCSIRAFCIFICSNIVLTILPIGIAQPDVSETEGLAEPPVCNNNDPTRINIEFNRSLYNVST